MLHSLWARRHGTKYNGAPYIQQRAGEAVYSPEGKKQLAEQVAYYMKNAAYIKEGLKSAGYTVSGGVNAPYIWLKAPNGMTSWEFFDYLLEKANEVGTPGSRSGHRFRLWPKRRNIFPSDCIRYLRKHSRSDRENQEAVSI